MFYIVLKSAYVGLIYYKLILPTVKQTIIWLKITSAENWPMTYLQYNAPTW